MRIVAISDTHGAHEELELPAGDVLVHAGDFCRWGVDFDEVRAFLAWFAAQPHPHKVLIAGNHDLVVEREPAAFRALVPTGVTYLEDSAAEIGGFHFWGSPWTPEFYDWAYMLPRGEPLRARWDLIPAETDVLITHGPPYGHGDVALPHVREHPSAVGCAELLSAVRRVRPRLHVFGHIHEGHGVSLSDELPETVFANAASSTVDLRGLHPPLVLEVG